MTMKQNTLFASLSLALGFLASSAQAHPDAPFVLQSTETSYTNQHGELVARSRGLSIAR